ncbi:MAG: NYN domain-containing protein, partial [Blastocatellia bacterium]
MPSLAGIGTYKHHMLRSFGLSLTLSGGLLACLHGLMLEIRTVSDTYESRNNIPPARAARGKLAIFIDGNNLFHAARGVGVEIDYAKFLTFLRGESPLLRAFFYTGVDEKAERQQGFLLWMRRNGYRVVE